MTDRLVSDEELVERVAECIAAGETIPAGGASPTMVATGLSISPSTADKHLRRLANAGRLERDFGVRNGARKTGYRPVPEDRCDRCDGDGEIERADRTVPCPHCHGVGRTGEERELRADGGDGTSSSGTDRSFIRDLNDTQKGLLAIRLGYPLEITTPTGKRLEAMEECGETVVVDHTDGRTQYGEQARERVKKTLRAVGTECTLSTDSDHPEGDA
ncbi:hypothetical protein [Natrinema thermotolerans]